MKRKNSYTRADRCGINSKSASYPDALKDIPAWRQRELEENIRWFLRLSPSKRLEYIDREMMETKSYIKTFSVIEKWKKR